MTGLKRRNNVSDTNQSLIKGRYYIFIEGQRQRLSPLQAIVHKRLKQGSLTNLEAINELGTTSLSARIYDLRERGLCIGTYRVRVCTRHAQYSIVAKYSLFIDGDE